ncbi:MAG: MBL fold metallo-hydrolase [Verrucomicrobiaceae bacterium]|nr:MAG: MBL fold metallo-hydrolase [Verrucomicrobiaceae bacterium]
MSLIFERIHTEGIAELSYLVGDDSTGTAAVFDPTVDVDRYLTLARKHGLSITHVFETHIHADLVSGACELKSRSGTAEIHVSKEGGAKYEFSHRAVADGDRFEFGDTVVTVKHTPGHTPEHVSYLLAEKGRLKNPWGVLTGDSLFVGSAGRPDLLGDDRTQELAKQQFHTLRNFYLKLDDSVMVYPSHGSGSPCGADIGDRLESTIGYERRFNPFLQFDNARSFTRHALESAPPVPTYYPVMKKVNAAGPKVFGPEKVPALDLEEFRKALKRRSTVLVDTRHLLAFGGGHIPGALHIGGSPLLSVWAGWMLEAKDPILLVLDDDSRAGEIATRFRLTGYNRFAGYLVGGIGTWAAAGNPLASIPQISVHDLREAAGELQILDVRGPGEWEKGHVPGARHIFLPELMEKAAQLDRTRPVAVYCGSGYRASIGASLLKREGFEVRNVPGSWQAWKAAGYPVEKG